MTAPINAAMITAAVMGARMSRRGKRQSGNTFADLCQQFMQSPRWILPKEKGGYANLTKRAWKLELDFACRKDALLGSMPISDVWPGAIKGYLNGWADRPGKQRNALDAFRQLDAWAAEMFPDHRPFTYGLKNAERSEGHTPWTDEQVLCGETHARNGLARVITLGANTGQRGSDLVRMGFGDCTTFQGRDWIRVTQVKTGRKVLVPILKPLALAMATWEKRPGAFCRDKHDEPLLREQLTNNWRYERNTNPQLAPLKELVLHGLRSHACIRYHRDGLNNDQIGRLVGMDAQTVKTYTRNADADLDAVAAVIHLENFIRTPGPKVGKTGNDSSSN